MRTILIIFCLAFAFPVTPGCTTPPSARVVAVQTLRAVGATAEAAVATSAQLFKDGRITAQQARDVMAFYDSKFQPAFRLAVTASKSNLDSIASPDLVTLATQLTTLVSQLYNAPPR